MRPKGQRSVTKVLYEMNMNQDSFNLYGYQVIAVHYIYINVIFVSNNCLEGTIF